MPLLDCVYSLIFTYILQFFRSVLKYVSSWLILPCFSAGLVQFFSRTLIIAHCVKPTFRVSDMCSGILGPLLGYANSELSFFEQPWKPAKPYFNSVRSSGGSICMVVLQPITNKFFDELRRLHTKYLNQLSSTTGQQPHSHSRTILDFFGGFTRIGRPSTVAEVHVRIGWNI